MKFSKQETDFLNRKWNYVTHFLASDKKPCHKMFLIFNKKFKIHF